MQINFKTKTIAKQYKYFEEIDSTNTYIKQNLNKLPNGFVAFSTNQTDGYGSKRRIWHSTKNESLAVSILFKNVNQKFLRTSTIMAGISIIECLGNLNIKNATIKWFNDIIISGKKIAGILGESQIQGNINHCILGIGVNLLQSTQSFQKLNLPFAGSILSQTNVIIKPIDMLIYLTNSIEANLNKSTSILFKQYSNFCSTLNNKIKFINIETNETKYGFAKNILPNGNLIVYTNDNETVELDSCKFSIFHI